MVTEMKGEPRRADTIDSKEDPGKEWLSIDRMRPRKRSLCLIIRIEFPRLL